MATYDAYVFVDRDGQPSRQRLNYFSATTNDEAIAKAAAAMREWPGYRGDVWRTDVISNQGIQRRKVATTWCAPYRLRERDDRERGELDD